MEGFNDTIMTQIKTALRPHMGNSMHNCSIWLQERQSNLPAKMTPIFHEMLNDCLEDYIDGIVVKSREAHNLVNDRGESLKDVGSTNFE